MWNTFNIKNLGDYHNLHVQTATFLLTGIFETFIETRRNMILHILVQFQIWHGFQH